MKKVLLIGGSGLVGSRISDLLSSEYEVIIGSRSAQSVLGFQTVAIDSINKELVNNTIQEINPDIIIHLVALSSVELCEQKREEAFLINVTGTENIVMASQKIGAHFIFISTGFVFDGINPPFQEGTIPHPTQYYGETKYLAEQLVVKYQGLWSVIRFNYPYRGEFSEKTDCVRWMLPKLKNGEKITVVEDQKVRPVFIDSIAKGIKAIIEKKAVGYFHFADKDTLTWVEFAKLVAEVYGYDQDMIQGITYEKYIKENNRVAVPLDVSLDTKETEKSLGIQMQSVRENLEEMKAQRKEIG